MLSRPEPAKPRLRSRWLLAWAALPECGVVLEGVASELELSPPNLELLVVTLLASSAPRARLEALLLLLLLLLPLLLRPAPTAMVAAPSPSLDEAAEEDEGEEEEDRKIAA